MTTTTIAPVIGSTVRYDLTSGDSYIGEIASVHGDLVTLANYSAWYADADAPYQSGHPDDEVRFRIDARTVVSNF
jgi:hypothetical protein